MNRLHQFVLPGLLIIFLLAANLLPLGGKKDAVRPTPAPPVDQSTTVTYPDLPGRLIVRQGDLLQLLQNQKKRDLPLPSPFTLPDDPQTAFSPDGRWVAGFTRQGDQTFLDALDLTSGAVTRVRPAAQGQMSWSPDSQRIAVWAGNRIAIYEFPLGGTSERSGDDATVSEVAWSPDGKQLAVVYTQANSDRSALEGFDFARGFGGHPISPDGANPFWAPNGEGLVYARHLKEGSPTTELVLRRPDGQEDVLATAEQLVKADPAAAVIQGAEPSLIWIGGATNPGVLLFTLKFYSGVNPRYAIGSVSLSGAGLHLFLLPVQPDAPGNQGHSPPLPCNTGRLFPSEAAVLYFTDGPGCEGQVNRLDLQTWSDESFGSATGNRLIAPDGSYWLQRSSNSMPTATSTEQGRSVLVPLYGEPLHWDQGIR